MTTSDPTFERVLSIDRVQIGDELLRPVGRVQYSAGVGQAWRGARLVVVAAPMLVAGLTTLRVTLRHELRRPTESEVEEALAAFFDPRSPVDVQHPIRRPGHTDEALRTVHLTQRPQRRNP